MTFDSHHFIRSRSFPDSELHNDLFRKINFKAVKVDNQTRQNIFTSADKTIIFAPDKKWDKQEWTFIKMNKVHKNLSVDPITTAYCEVTSKNFQKLRRNEGADKITNRLNAYWRNPQYWTDIKKN